MRAATAKQIASGRRRGRSLNINAWAMNLLECMFVFWKNDYGGQCSRMESIQPSIQTELQASSNAATLKFSWLEVALSIQWMTQWVALSGLWDHGSFQSNYNLGVTTLYTPCFCTVHIWAFPLWPNPAWPKSGPSHSPWTMTWLTTKDIIEPPERDEKFSSVEACHMHPCWVAATSNHKGDGIENVIQTARSKRRQTPTLWSLCVVYIAPKQLRSSCTDLRLFHARGMLGAPCSTRSQAHWVTVFFWLKIQPTWPTDFHSTLIILNCKYILKAWRTKIAGEDLAWVVWT